MKEKLYLCIDLKSFYASVECVARNLDPLTTNLVVADKSRTEKTICLAVSPSLKSYGLAGRARLFEVVQKVKQVNNARRLNTAGRKFSGKSSNYKELALNPNLEADYIVAPPRMAHYIDCSSEIYKIYLQYAAPEDIHVYSIDEVFIDISNYLDAYKLTAQELAMKIIHEVLAKTGITATAGIGTNMYLAKIAMDIVAKKMKPDKYGVRIAFLDEYTYRKELWTHTPITDFWRVGKGYAKKLEANYIYTMGDIAEMSLSEYGEDKLYRLFGINAELLIDHAWGWEPCTIKDIKEYKPDNKSLGTGQVLHCPYEFDKAKLIVKEMLELLALDLVEKRLVTDQIVITVGYDIDNLKNSKIKYDGEITTDFYGRRVPKHAHGTVNLGRFTSSAALISDKVMELFDNIVDMRLLVRRVNICANHLIAENEIMENDTPQQFDLFTDYEQLEKDKEKEAQELLRERALQETTIKLRNRFGKNAVFKGMNLQEGATAKERNRQIGGHKA